MFAVFMLCVMMVGMVVWFGFGEQKVMEYLRKKDAMEAMLAERAEIIEMPIRGSRARKAGCPLEA